LFLSHRESQGNVLLEALSFKLTCICWDIIGVNEVIENNKNGFLCKFGDILDICSKIELVFSSNYKLNFDYKFNKKFLLEESVKTTIKIYESL
jgi:glycosyltransferase involved in cell wall biosynthesis